MICELRGFPALQEVRGAHASDLGALLRAPFIVSPFAAENVMTIESLDMSPFPVLPAGEMAVAFDAVVVHASAKEETP